MSDALSDLLDGLARGRAALAKATTMVEWETDPARPGRTTYRITGESAAAVQAAITARMNATEESGGYASFTNPKRTPDGKFDAIGEVILNVATEN